MGNQGNGTNRGLGAESSVVWEAVLADDGVWMSQRDGDDTQDTFEYQDSIHEKQKREGASGGHLRVVYRADGEDEGEIFTLLDGHYVLGRTRSEAPGERAIHLPDRGISRRHLQLWRRAEGTSVKDLDSRNGSFVNGTPVPQSSWLPLSDGDIIRVGESLLIFRDGGAYLGSWSDKFMPGWAWGVAAIRQRVAQLATLSVPVLFLGETGTGKEYAARALHDSSARALGPFIPVNCGELARGLSRAELFGREAGAYTDAKGRRIGLVGQGSGGTLFLDEIGDLEPEVQVELIRFLQDGKYRRVGGDALLHADARIVAATNVSLDQAVQEGRFRQDLLARLRAPIAPIRLVPLRARREDILSWARLFLAEAAREFQCALPRWKAGFAECVLLHPWPDNLRELRMVICTALLESKGAPRLEAAHLDEALVERRRRARVVPLPPSSYNTSAQTSVPGAPTRAEVIAALTSTGGVMKATAVALGVSRRKLYRLCDALEIDYADYRGQ